MARISGVNIPTNKKVYVALTYIFGIGPKIANDICLNASIDMTKRVNQLNDDELNKIREIIDQKHQVEGDLRRKISMDKLIHNSILPRRHCIFVFPKTEFLCLG